MTVAAHSSIDPPAKYKKIIIIGNTNDFIPRRISAFTIWNFFIRVLYRKFAAVSFHLFFLFYDRKMSMKSDLKILHFYAHRRRFFDLRTTIYFGYIYMYQYSWSHYLHLLTDIFGIKNSSFQFYFWKMKGFYCLNTYPVPICKKIIIYRSVLKFEMYARGDAIYIIILWH